MKTNFMYHYDLVWHTGISMLFFESVQTYLTPKEVLQFEKKQTIFYDLSSLYFLKYTHTTD